MTLAAGVIRDMAALALSSTRACVREGSDPARQAR